VAESTYDYCRSVLGTVEDALNLAGRPVAESFVGAGIVAWDDCCGGLLSVVPERVYRTVTFPDEFNAIEQCFGGFIVINLAVFLLRCVPTVDDRMAAPTAEAKDDAYRALLDDGAIVWGAVAGPLGDGWERAGIGQLFAGDQGGCVSVETRFVLGIDLDRFD
jgi:hypothetical protein